MPGIINEKHNANAYSGNMGDLNDEETLGTHTANIPCDLSYVPICTKIPGSFNNCFTTFVYLSTPKICGNCSTYL